jgi:hypothetical protein
MHEHLPFMTARNKLMFWRQIRASRGTIISTCCEVGPVHHQGTSSELSTHEVFGPKEENLFQVRDKKTELNTVFVLWHVPHPWLVLFSICKM